MAEFVTWLHNKSAFIFSGFIDIWLLAGYQITGFVALQPQPDPHLYQPLGYA
jgi:hypothetical protein